MALAVWRNSFALTEAIYARPRNVPVDPLAVSSYSHRATLHTEIQSKHTNKTGLLYPLYFYTCTYFFLFLLLSFVFFFRLFIFFSLSFFLSFSYYSFIYVFITILIRLFIYSSINLFIYLLILLSIYPLTISHLMVRLLVI